MGSRKACCFFIVTADGFSDLFGALKDAQSIKNENKRIIFDIYSVDTGVSPLGLINTLRIFRCLHGNI